MNLIDLQLCNLQTVRVTPTLMDNAARRVRARINEWLEKQGHGSKKRLADAVHAAQGDPTDTTEGQGWTTGIISGKQDLRLKDLDTVADLLGEPPGTLVRKAGHNYHELTMAEERLVKYYRSMPEMVRHNWISFLDYLFRFQQAALEQQGNERSKRTAKARRREPKAARKKAVSE